MLPVPIAANVPDAFIWTPFEVPWAVNLTGSATEVPKVLTWKSGPVPVLPVVSWIRKGLVVEEPAVKVVVKFPIESERLPVGLAIADQVLDAPAPVAEIVMMFGELVEMAMPEPAAIEVVAFERPLMAAMPPADPHPRHDPVTRRLLTVVVAELTVKLPGIKTFRLLCPMVMAVAEAVPTPNVPLVSKVMLVSPCRPVLLTVRVARLRFGHDSSKARKKTRASGTKGMRPLSFVLRISFEKLNGLMFNDLGRETLLEKLLSAG